MSINVQVSPIPNINILVGNSGNLLNLSPQGYTLHANTHISGGIDAIDHNYLLGLQGGQSNQYYHLNSGEYFNLVTGSVVRPSETGVLVARSETGLFYAASNPSGFVTGSVVRPSETGAFYASSNPSGFITGVDLSSYATQVYVTGVSGSLQTQITSLSNSTGSYVLNTQTGQFYASSNPSGFITGINNLVYTTGNQIISGEKTFDLLSESLVIGISIFI
jgi:hypothetical protein